MMIAPVTKTKAHQRMETMTAAAKTKRMETISEEQLNESKERLIAPVSRSGMCKMRYRVTDASVKKMTQNGNRVIFDEDRSFIQNKRTGQEMNLISENGVYKLDVVFMNGDKAERGNIVIDSGAADNAMPDPRSQ